MFSRFIHVVACPSTLFFLWLNNIPWYGYTTFTYELMNTFKLLCMILLCTFMYKLLCAYMFISLEYVHLGKKLMGMELSIQKSKIMASGSIISWQIHGETMETVIDFIFLGSQITAMKLKALAPCKKSYDKPR